MTAFFTSKVTGAVFLFNKKLQLIDVFGNAVLVIIKVKPELL